MSRLKGNLHGIDESIISDKYRYLGDYIRLTAKIDNVFTFASEASDVAKIRNDVLHCNRNPYPTRGTACEAIDKVDMILRYFYSDFAE